MVPEVDISIIIPCYKSEKTLEETLNSVYHQDYLNWEAIIVNDGSTDNLESIALAWVEKDNRFKYYKKENGGLGAARNFGIKKSIGAYILPLDSDNKIRPDFASNAIKVLDENSKVGVVYGDAMYFGERSGIWKVGTFDKYRMLYTNYIDACTIIKKKVFDTIGLYDENLPHQGHEDWDFWLRAIAADIQFYYIESITFEYRVSSNSMIRSFDKKMSMENIKYIKRKNADLYISNFTNLFSDYKNLKASNSKSIFKKILKRIKF
ncbi:MAG: glycosyltransferase [bacterium]|nr:glycosyltransferase [bacterium]